MFVSLLLYSYFDIRATVTNYKKYRQINILEIKKHGEILLANVQLNLIFISIWKYFLIDILKRLCTQTEDTNYFKIEVDVT